MRPVQEMTSQRRRYGLDVRVVVLVGGRDFGRCPLAAQTPTALWPLAEKPVLAHLLDHLAEAGFGQAAVCCAYDDAAAVKRAVRNAPLDVTLVVEELPAGTAGCLRDGVAADPGDLILALSGSMLAPPALEDLIEAHRAGGAELTIVFNPGRDGERSPGGPAEIYLCRPEVLSHVPPGGYCDIKEGLIPALLRAGGAVRPVVLGREAGNFHNRRGYLEALRVLFPQEPGRDLDAGAWAPTGSAFARQGADVLVHPTARLHGPVLIGDRARLAEEVVVVGPAMIGPDVSVDAQSVIARSAVWAHAHVGARCEIRESILDCHTQLPAGTEIVDRTISPRLSGRRSDRLLRSGLPDDGCRAEAARSFFGRLAAGLPEGVPRSGRALAYASGGLIVLAAFLWSFWPTFADLWDVWHRSDEYSSGLLVPFLAGYVLWLRRRELQPTAIRPALWFGLGAFLVAQAVRGAGTGFYYSSAERVSIVLTLAALVLLVLGWRYLVKVASILLFLCLMLPWPHRIQSAVTLPLQRWSTTAAVFCLELAGYDIRQDGNVIHIGHASVAVAEACNGLRMITAFFVISGLVALLVKRAWWEKLILLGSSLPIAFLCNTLRLAVTAVAFTLIEGEEWEQRFHDWGGYMMMPVALALVVGELWLLARLTTPPLEVEPVIISRRSTQQVADP
ncbi:MAG: exosortase [Planctomycetes bacterium]|nr:exosortase [Planctomycetota bacterium]